jgi:nucleoside-diphosphate-sugar epimerase
VRSVVFGDRQWRRIFAGKSAECMGDPDQVHSYAYTPDVADGLARLGADPDARGVWMLPAPPPETTRQAYARLSRIAGRDIALSRIPTFLLRSVGLVSPLMREVAEMTYQWRQPFVLDDTSFRARYGVRATPWDEALAATWTWARATYGDARAAA